MVTIIAGSRSIKDMKILKEAIRQSGFHIHAVLSGGARGVDQLGEGYAAANGLTLLKCSPRTGQGKANEPHPDQINTIETSIDLDSNRFAIRLQNIRRRSRKQIPTLTQQRPRHNHASFGLFIGYQQLTQVGEYNLTKFLGLMLGLLPCFIHIASISTSQSPQPCLVLERSAR